MGDNILGAHKTTFIFHTIFLFYFTILTPFSALSKAHTCTQIFSPIKQYITDISGLNELDWKNQKGWGVFKQKKIFTQNEISHIRRQLSKTEDLELNVLVENLFQKSNELFGPKIATKLYDYAMNAIQLVNQQTGNLPFKVNFWLRSEKSPYRFEQGHYHRDNTLTVTRAELGESSWIASEGPGTVPFHLYKANRALVFTNQFHGGTMENTPRLLMIIFFDFTKN